MTRDQSITNLATWYLDLNSYYFDDEGGMATPAPPPSEEELAERLREKFLEEHSDDPEVDSRDVTRIRENLPYLCKFVRHNRKNFTNAYNHLVECMKWRKSFGVNDIQFAELDENLWKMGMAYNHGCDREGSHIVVLNIHLHRKNSKKFRMLQRWIAFCYETHQRNYPHHRMCLIFNMNDAGLSNMDMDLMRFIVNCFKIYFPDLLGALLIFNMPWILQAAWKIVRSWLSENAAEKVRFVNSETVQDYVSSDQLLERFGGTDPWEYDYPSEMRRFSKELARAWKDQKNLLEEEDSEVDNTDLEHQAQSETLVNGEQDPASGFGQDNSASGSISALEQHSGEAEEVEGGRKQVRFSANLPPTRQSRFGDLAEEDKQLSSLDNHVLMPGSTSKMRRRQVHKLMGQQRDQEWQGRRAISIPIVGDTLSRAELFPRRRYSEPQTQSGISYLMISPPQELLFAGNGKSDVLCTLTLTNVSENMVAYKIKTTAPLRYKVRPNLALIDPKSVAKVHVLLVPNCGNTTISQDKFLVQSCSFEASVTVPTQSNLSAFWKSLSDGMIQEHRMKCRWLNHVAATLPPTARETKGAMASDPAASSPKGTPRVADKSTEPQATKEMHSLQLKIDKVIASNVELTMKVKRLQQFNLIALLLLVLILVIVYF